MALQQFSHALLTEHLLIVCCQAYRQQESLLEIARSLENPGRKLCLALPYAALVDHHKELSSLNIWKGLSDIYSIDSETFSGSVAIRMAKEAKIDFAVVGGPISRNVLYEGDQILAAKIRGLLDADITPVVCFGENLQDYLRGTSSQVIKEQLGALLLGLSFDQLTQVILVYKSPWVDYIAPEHFAEESEKFHAMVLEVMQHLFGLDAASHIPLLTNLPYAKEDFQKISYDIPPSGYFLELAGKNPELVKDYFNILTAETIPSYPSKISKPTLESAKAITESIPVKKPRKSRKKKDESLVENVTDVHELSEVETEVEVSEQTVEDSHHQTILSIENELEESTLHFELQPTNEIDEKEPEEPTTEDSAFDWFSEEELESLQKEFGMTSDGHFQLPPPPEWDNSHHVRVIKTQAQKNEKPKKKK